jgi:hypothetical protein
LREPSSAFCHFSAPTSSSCEGKGGHKRVERCRGGTVAVRCYVSKIERADSRARP